jgi:hypothetical protein
MIEKKIYVNYKILYKIQKFSLLISSGNYEK